MLNISLDGEKIFYVCENPEFVFPEPPEDQGGRPKSKWEAVASVECGWNNKWQRMPPDSHKVFLRLLYFSAVFLHFLLEVISICLFFRNLNFGNLKILKMSHNVWILEDVLYLP